MKMPRPHAADMIIKIKPRSVREKKARQESFSRIFILDFDGLPFKNSTVQSEGEFAFRCFSACRLLTVLKTCKSFLSPVCPCPPAPLPAPSGNSIPSLTLHPCFPKHTRVTHLLSNYSSVCEPAGGRGRNTAAGRFVCGRCKTAQVIFNWLPVIVSLLGTCIVPSFFRNPTHLALRQVKTNTDANI